MIAAKKVSGLLSEKPNLVSLNAVIQGLCVEQRGEEAEEVFEEMKRKGLAIDERTYTSLIHFFSDWASYYVYSKPHYSEKADKVLSEMIDSGFSPSVDTYNKLIHAYCEDRRVEEIVGILRSMVERGVSPDAVSYSNFISGFCEIEEFEKALEIKEEMLQKGFLPDADTYSKLLHGLREQLKLSEAFDLFREMLRGGVPPEQYAYIHFMKAYCKIGEFSKAFHLHDEMIHKGFLPHFVTEFSPSIFTCKALIHGLCFLGRAEEALEILRGMPEMGLSRDTVSYANVVSEFCRIGELRKAFDLKLEMDDIMRWSTTEYMEPLYGDAYWTLMDEEVGLFNKVNYTSVINAYCADGELWKVDELFDEFSVANMPESVMYGVFINGLYKKAKTREAQNFQFGWRSSPPLTCDILIENCSNNEFKSVVELVKGFQMKDLENEAASVMNIVLQWNYKPDGAVYNFLIVEHCRYDNVDKAYDMYMEMVHCGFALHMFSVLALINALRYGNRYSEMSWVIQNTLRSCNINDSELHKVLHEIRVRKFSLEVDALLNVLAEIAMDGLLLNGGKSS